MCGFGWCFFLPSWSFANTEQHGQQSWAEGRRGGEESRAGARAGEKRKRKSDTSENIHFNRIITRVVDKYGKTQRVKKKKKKQTKGTINTVSIGPILVRASLTSDLTSRSSPRPEGTSGSVLSGEGGRGEGGQAEGAAKQRGHHDTT